MTNSNHPPKIPWWVSYWTGPTTTRSTLRQEAWLFFLMAAGAVSVGTFYVFWRPVWMGVIVLPVAFGVLPVGFTVAGIWILVAARWIDRHQVWDRITTRQEREAYAESQSLWMRSLPWGLLLLAVGGAIGTLSGGVWETGVGIPVGAAFGAMVGFVVGIFLAGIREGIRPKVGKAADVKSPGSAEGAAMEEAVATYNADTGRHRARVFRVSSGGYRVEVERLYEADDAGGVVHGVFWSRVRGFSSYTDDLERAEALAQENLRCAQAAEP